MITNRRYFLEAGTVAAAGLLAAARSGEAAEWTPTEKANVQVVNDFCAAWVTGDVAKIVSYMAEDALFRQGATMFNGRQASVDRITKVFAQYPKIEFEVVETFARGPIVFNERKDWLDQPGQPRRLIHLVGVFVVRNGKIAEWTDYGLS